MKCENCYSMKTCGKENYAAICSHMDEDLKVTFHKVSNSNNPFRWQWQIRQCNRKIYNVTIPNLYEKGNLLVFSFLKGFFCWIMKNWFLFVINYSSIFQILSRGETGWNKTVYFFVKWEKILVRQNFLTTLVLWVTWKFY